MVQYDYYNQLKGNILQQGDTIIFWGAQTPMKRPIRGTVGRDHIYLHDVNDNGLIFTELGIPSKVIFCTNAYGYDAKTHTPKDWPECKAGDMAALTRAVLKLFQIIEGEHMYEPTPLSKEYFHKTKIKVPKEHSKATQEYLFSLGCQWNGGGRNALELYDYHIYVEDGKMTHGGDDTYFSEHRFKEVPFSAIPINVGDKMPDANINGVPVKLEEMNKANLKEAQRQFTEERNNAEVTAAKALLKQATDEINRLDREIKAREEAKKPWQETLAKFK